MSAISCYPNAYQGTRNGVIRTSVLTLIVVPTPLGVRTSVLTPIWTHCEACPSQSLLTDSIVFEPDRCRKRHHFQEQFPTSKYF